MKREPLDVTREAWARNFCLFTFAFCLALPAQQALAFKITEPVEGGKLTAGKTITARVELGKDSGIVPSVTIGTANRMTPWSNRRTPQPRDRSLRRWH